MENTAPISHAFLVKLVIQLMTHGAAGFLHKTETVGNVARLACDVPGTHCLLDGAELFQDPPDSVCHGPLLPWSRTAGQIRQEPSPECALDQGRAARSRGGQAGRPFTEPRPLVPN